VHGVWYRSIRLRIGTREDTLPAIQPTSPPIIGIISALNNFNPISSVERQITSSLLLIQNSAVAHLRLKVEDRCAIFGLVVARLGLEWRRWGWRLLYRRSSGRYVWRGSSDIAGVRRG
jgi:hypothetical protein